LQSQDVVRQQSVEVCRTILTRDHETATGSRPIQTGSVLSGRLIRAEGKGRNHDAMLKPMRWLHCTRALLAVAVMLSGATASAQQANFTVFIAGAPMGGEQIGVARTGDGWTI